MSETKVTIQKDGEVAIISIASPPVNALSGRVRQGIWGHLQAALADPEIKAIVLAGSARAFSGGADLTEFGKSTLEPGLNPLIDGIEAAEKPVVAAVEGLAYGGGFEIVLGAHYRVLGPKATLALPEVKIGIIPGAGGTQRLPRLIGPIAALAPIVTGDPITAQQALDLGIADAVVQGDVIAESIDFARKIADNRPLNRISQNDEFVRGVDQAEFEAEASRLLSRSRKLKAPQGCVAAVRASMTQSFEQGMATEHEVFHELRESDESKAMRHLFFAERAALKLPGVAKATAPRQVEKIAVLGAGTMGGGITMSMATGGYDVTIIDLDPAALKRGLDIIENNYRKTQARGGFTEAEVTAALSRIHGSTDFEDVKNADMVIEAVFENMDLKKRIFADLDRLCKLGTVLASNTSSLDLDEIASVTKRPEDVIGMHFFSPANVMKLLENVRGAKTAPEVLVTANAVAKRAGKVPVTVGVCNGFVGNRMGASRGRQVHALMLEGAMPQQIDRAATSFGFAMGPLATNDLAGLDVGYLVRQERGEVMEIPDAIVEKLGRKGQKTKAGFYRYEEGSRSPIPDPEIETLISDIRRDKGFTPRAFSDDEIVERLIFPLINEAAQILDEGIATRASDIDLIYINGFGFPLWTGGPMAYADRVGVAEVASKLAQYAEMAGSDELKPKPLLARLAAEGRSFADFDRERG
ncbi:3-hydroxyacyl-CoA dehydrogenase NAD-binding domain-containing protein [Pseudooceanicola sp.]|uniref:3-hydroxyacyl-CoA dehydrogenase NAD-binding domain-containing protein n=1 Tax=Pseudooceanicola sp. TaxID=1914328 RepID=UPI00261D1826|nr:3-hydroxyacyl-CoA dehydrogenase NAD-binding domain-containing protein [Pseudooceanicola sp.]MDF1855619.1 3-hydroxyacyl-CoA dehydrogenase NAD-binding domain-containing protein [Pseudooceanicola sp.]